VTSFNADVKPKFRPVDIACMNRQQPPVSLADYNYMSDPSGDLTYPNCANARHVLAHLAGTEMPKMPLNGPYWSDNDLQTLQEWIEGGTLP
jgi:hypothetical protein